MNRIITITGPSCAGKTTLESLLKSKGCVNAISTTTRPMRTGEVNGSNYYFTDEAEFFDMVKRGEFVEWVKVSGHHYGLTEKELKRCIDSGAVVVIVVNPKGKREVENFCQRKRIACQSVFIDGNTKTIAERFLKRVISDASKYGDENAVIAHALRLSEMMTEERDWVEFAIEGNDQYGVFVRYFDETNANQVANMILSGYSGYVNTER